MSEIELERDGDLAIVRLNRPDVLNAQTPQMWAELAEIGETLAGVCSAVVLTGSGTSFSAGLDRRMFTPEGVPGAPSLFALAALPDAEVLNLIETFQAGFTVWADAPFVSIAAVEGHAIGAGFQLALACDVVIAGRSASFAMKEVTWGLVPDLAGTAPLIARIGRTRALQACLAGHALDASEPGLVDDIVADGAALDAAVEYARGLPAPDLTVELANLLAAFGRAERVAQRERERHAQLRRLRALAGGAPA